MRPLTNTKNVTADTYVLKQSPSWNPSYVSTTTSPRLLSSYCEKWPATVINKPNKMGYRSPSAYYRDWFRASIPWSEWSTKPKPGYSVWFQRPSWTPLLGGPLARTADNAQWTVNQALFMPSAFDVLQSDSVARTRALEKLSQRKFNLGETLHDFKQTVGLVTGVAKDIWSTTQFLTRELPIKSAVQRQRFMRELYRSGNFYTAADKVLKSDVSRDYLTAISDRWLAFQLGLKPALYDIQDACTALDVIRSDPNTSLMLVTAKAGHTVESFLTLDSPTVSFLKSTIFCATKVTTHYSVAYEMPVGGVPAYTTLGLDNSLSLLYETTKLSWLFDYVVDVGSWLASWSATNGLVFHSGTVSTLKRCTATGYQVDLVKSYNTMWDKKPSHPPLILDSGSFRRELLTRGVTPALLPQIKSTLGLTQLANALSVLSQIVRR